MPTTLFTFVSLYSRLLDTAAHLLNKGVAHAKAHGVSENEMLDWRLIDDMQPLRFQLMVVCDFAQAWPARVAGLPAPAAPSADLGVQGFHDAIAASGSFLAGLAPEQFAGRDEVPLTYTLGTGMTATLPSARWLTVFATTNLYFHLSTAYDILRARGVAIGKADLFPKGL